MAVEESALEVDTAVLAQVRSGLEVLAAELAGVCARVRAVDGLSVGARPLLVELERTAADWGAGVEQLAALATGAAGGLGAAAGGYDACEAVVTGRVTAPGSALAGAPLGPPVPGAQVPWTPSPFPAGAVPGPDGAPGPGVRRGGGS